jgi:hypothetical protein
MLGRINEVAEMMEALENLPKGNPLKDNPAYQAVAKRRYVRVPKIISITRPEEVLGFLIVRTCSRAFKNWREMPRSGSAAQP